MDGSGNRILGGKFQTRRNKLERVDWMIIKCFGLMERMYDEKFTKIIIIKEGVTGPEED